MGLPLKLDPESGFLQGANTENDFTGEKKKLFLKAALDHVLATKTYPPVHEICKALNIGLRTWKEHCARDSAFKLAWIEVKEHLNQILTQSLSVKANMKQNTIANLAMLRWIEAGVWNPQGNLNPINHGAPTKVIINNWNDVIDAEIIPENNQLNASISQEQGNINHLNKQTD